MRLGSKHVGEIIFFHPNRAENDNYNVSSEEHTKKSKSNRGYHSTIHFGQDI
jgi:hypothetical protein